MTYIANATISSSASGVVQNTATVTPPVGVSDPNTANNTATDNTALRTGGDRCGSDPNLVACYQLDEGSGNVYLDGVQNTVYNDGTTANSPSWVIGIAGTALNFNGTSQYGYTPDEASLDIANQITLAAWLKPGKVATQSLVNKAVNGNTGGYELSLAASTSTWPQKVFFRINQVSSGDTYRVNSATIYPIDGTWIHVAATFDGATMRMYINGVENGTPVSAPVPIATNGLPLSIGAEYNGTSATRWFQGAMDDVRVYNRALSAAEVLALYNAPLAVTLADFSALQTGNYVLLTWETNSELNNRGFNLYRGTSAAGPDRQLNNALIPSQSPGNTGGFVYTWEDHADLVSGTSYFYWIEVMWTSYGTSTLYGPVSVDFALPTAVRVSDMEADSDRTATFTWAAVLVMMLLAVTAGLGWARSVHR